MTEYEELREKIQEALGKLTKQTVDWERRDMPDFNRSIEIFSELQVTLLEILSIIAERCWLKDKRELPDYLMEGQTACDKPTYQEMLKRAGWRPVKEIKKEAK